jgi:hypothetical protein
VPLVAGAGFRTRCRDLEREAEPARDAEPTRRR